MQGTLTQTPTHTLAQNCHCEFCCGMHLTCKNTPITPDRNGSVKRPDKVSRSYHGHSQCRKSLNWKLTLPLSTWKLKKRLRKPYRKRSDFRLFENNLVVLGLATAPQVRRADRALYHHKLTVSSLGGVCQSCTVPANLKCNTMKSRPKRGTEYRKSSRLEVWHLFRWFTHTPLPRGFLRLREMRWRRRWKGNGSEVTMRMR